MAVARNQVAEAIAALKLLGYTCPTSQLVMSDGLMNQFVSHLSIFR